MIAGNYQEGLLPVHHIQQPGQEAVNAFEILNSAAEIAVVAQEVCQPVLEKGEANGLGESPELRARFLRRVEWNIRITQLCAPALAGEICGQSLLRYHLSPCPQPQTAAPRGVGDCAQQAFAALDSVKVALGIGVDEGGGMTRRVEAGEDAGLVEDVAHALVRAGTVVFPKTGGRVDAGQDRGLAGGALGAAGHAKVGVGRDQMRVTAAERPLEAVSGWPSKRAESVGSAAAASGLTCGSSSPRPTPSRKRKRTRRMVVGGYRGLLSINSTSRCSNSSSPESISL